MTYDNTKLGLMKVPNKGDVIGATVTEIKEGVLSDFVNKDTLASWKHADPGATAIQVTVKMEGLGWTRSKTIQYPTNGQVHPNSTLAKWKLGYGNYPTMGQTISLIADEDGMYQFLFDAL